MPHHNLRIPHHVRRARRLACGVLFFATLPAIPAATRPANGATVRPNVLLIITDDQGYGDLGALGAVDVRTPHLDALAARGLVFTQFYVTAPICSASRASVLTGRLPARVGIPWLAYARNRLRSDEVTLAEVFRAEGYATAITGKWHLGRTEESHPLSQGFDFFFGHIGGVIDNWSHFLHWGGPNRHDLYLDHEEVFRDGRYFPDLMTGEATRFIRLNRDRPFFLFYSINLPHYPYQATASWRGRFARLPYPRNLYAEFLAEMDDRIGQVLGEIDRQGLRERTIVVFVSDNGHSTELRAHGGGGSAGPFRGAKFSLFEGGIRVPAIAAWPGVLPEGETRDAPAYACDLLPTLAELCDTPLPTTKLDGISLAAHWRSADISLPPRTLHWQVGTGDNVQWAVRDGDWKLIVDTFDTTERQEDAPRIPLFLANLADDPAESRNLAKDCPNIVERLRARHEALMAEMSP